MSTSVTVNRSALARFDDLLRSMVGRGGQQMLVELAQRFSAAMWKFVADEFATSADPYGNPWAPLKHPRTRDRKAAERIRKKAWRAAGGMGSVGRMLMPSMQAQIKGPKVLVDTGRMSRSTGARANGTLARVSIPTWYAAVHQDGATIEPRERSRVTSGRSGTRGMGQLGRMLRVATVRAVNVTPLRATVIPRRQMLPDEKGGIPPKWEDAFEKESIRLIDQRWGGHA